MKMPARTLDAFFPARMRAWLFHVKRMNENKLQESNSVFHVKHSSGSISVIPRAEFYCETQEFSSVRSKTMRVHA
jgi:hypothetical protein